MIDIFRNPVIIALLMGTLTYMYLWWCNEEKYKKDPKNNRKTSVWIPVAVTISTWILAYGYHMTYPDTVGSNTTVNTNGIPKALSDSLEQSFHLIGKGVSIPNKLNLPDVFIETM